MIIIVIFILGTKLLIQEQIQEIKMVKNGMETWNQYPKYITDIQITDILEHLQVIHADIVFMILRMIMITFLNIWNFMMPRIPLMEVIPYIEQME